ncbi:beta-COP [Cryptosporidium felis]|nr:beta-COP [Cryptosporidium felis]
MFEYEKNCTLLVPAITGTNPPTSSELQKRLEDPSDAEKCKALRELIVWMTHGESYSRLLMTVIRYVVQSTNHKVKKYLQLYWEIVEKCNSDGSLKEEMILVCNALRNDLQHPNEYIRGSTLRLLCNLRFIKLIQPLIESILENLQHRHSYVRRNAVMCIYSILKTFGVDIIPNAVDEVEKLLLIEGDVSTKRNAFLVLTFCDVERSLRYILSIQENVTYMGDVIQMVLLELLGKNYKDFPNYRNNLVQLIINITQSGSPAVSFEGANTLIKIGNYSPNNTVKIAMQAYIKLLLTNSDNNVRYLVLNKISKITRLTSALYVLQRSFIKDILRILLCTNSYSLRIKVIEIVLSSLITKNNCLDIFQFLIKHLQQVSLQGQKYAPASNGGDFGAPNNAGVTPDPESKIASERIMMMMMTTSTLSAAPVTPTAAVGASASFGDYDNYTRSIVEVGYAGAGAGSRMSLELHQFRHYQLVLIKSLHEITRRFYRVTLKPMIATMMAFLSNDDPVVVNEIAQFLKEMVIGRFLDSYQKEVVEGLIVQLPSIRFSKPLRTCLWILSECKYSSAEDVAKIIDTIYATLEPLPLRRPGSAFKRRTSDGLMQNRLDNAGEDGEELPGSAPLGSRQADQGRMSSDGAVAREAGSGGSVLTRTVILEDGTYATQDVFEHSGLSAPASGRGGQSSEGPDREGGGPVVDGEHWGFPDEVALFVAEGRGEGRGRWRGRSGDGAAAPPGGCSELRGPDIQQGSARDSQLSEV